ncbi:MAG: glycosyltransferase family 2 protein [Chloroflexota bacterium]|nr:glycosyltransferase family 2 protein [Chloroflexota bacterium]
MHCPTLTKLPSPPPGRTGWPWTEASAPLPDFMPDGEPWPRISIVTPSYNQAQFIEETIRSVLLQGYLNLEYIIIDGGSTDVTVEIIRKYEPWLSYWISEEDSGQSHAIKKGLERATGKIVTWLNSDDRLRPNTLSRVARVFKASPRVVFTCGDINLIDINGRVINRLYTKHPNRFLTVNYGQHGVPQPGAFWRRWAYEQVGGVDTSLKFCMDRDLFIRLWEIGPTKRIIGPPLADFRVHEQSKTATMKAIRAKEQALILERYSNPRWQSRQILLSVLWWIWEKLNLVRVLLSKLLKREI